MLTLPSLGGTVGPFESPSSVGEWEATDEVADLIAQVSPEARNLVLYRDLAPFMLSITRGFGLLGQPLETRRAWSAALLMARPREMMEMILAYLGLPASRVDVALRAFERDSQAGSPLAREEVIDADARLEPEHWVLVRDLVGRYPLMDDALAKKALAVP